MVQLRPLLRRLGSAWPTPRRRLELCHCQCRALSSQPAPQEPVASTKRGLAAAAATIFAGYLWQMRNSGGGGLLGTPPPLETAGSAAALAQVERWEDAALAVLPDVEVAQRTSAVRRPQLLSDTDIDELLTSVGKMRKTAGRFGRDAIGIQQLGSAPWETLYLHTAGGFPALCAPLRQKLIDAAKAVDLEQGWGLLKGREGSCGPIQFRTVEYHEVTAEGALPDPHHYDGGSLVSLATPTIPSVYSSLSLSDMSLSRGSCWLFWSGQVTIDIMLQRPGVDFEGGNFTTEEPDGTATIHKFEKGDATFFVSHKYHSVQPVTRGRRAVLVCELWHGPERDCAHRCSKRVGHCDYSVASANADRLLKAQTPDLY